MGKAMGERNLPSSLIGIVTDEDTFEEELSARIEALAAVYRAAGVPEVSIRNSLDRVRTEACNSRNLYTQPTETAQALGITGRETQLRSLGATGVARIFDLTEDTSQLQERAAAGFASSSRSVALSTESNSAIMPYFDKPVIPIFTEGLATAK